MQMNRSAQFEWDGMGWNGTRDVLIIFARTMRLYMNEENRFFVREFNQKKIKKLEQFVC